MGDLGALILAAGNSSRLGQPKQFLKIGGETLLNRSIRTAAEAGCAPIVIVSGAVQIEEMIADPQPIVVLNENWARGMGTSIRAGLRAATLQHPNLGAIVILSCDQPQVRAETILALKAECDRTNKPIVASHYSGTLGIPALFACAIFPELENLPDASGAKPVIAADPSRVAAIDFPEGAIDIDTPGDLAALPKE